MTGKGTELRYCNTEEWFRGKVQCKGQTHYCMEWKGVVLKVSSGRVGTVLRI